MSHEHEQPDESVAEFARIRGDFPSEPNPKSGDFGYVEQALADVAPAAPRIDRDRLMFLAGVASATPGALAASGGREPAEVTANPTRNNWLWPATTATLAATSLALATALLVRPDPPERIVYLERPATNSLSPPAPPTQEQPSVSIAARRRSEPSNLPANNYLRSRDVALRFGLDALGSPATSGGGGSPAPTYRTWLESFAAPQPTSPGPKPESSQM